MSYPLEYTPRKFAIHQDSGHLIIIETDHNAYTEETKQARKPQMAEVGAGPAESTSVFRGEGRGRCWCEDLRSNMACSYVGHG